jgi:hypothetical protein|tara:strand:- start:1232 stop:1459 length:228 start_codon:yes stop_codon:yes gene_type:complete
MEPKVTIREMLADLDEALLRLREVAQNKKQEPIDSGLVALKDKLLKALGLHYLSSFKQEDEPSKRGRGRPKKGAK